MPIDILGRIKITDFELPRGIEKTLRDALTSPFADVDRLTKALAVNLRIGKENLKGFGSTIKSIQGDLVKTANIFAQIQSLSKDLLGGKTTFTQAKQQVRELSKSLADLSSDEAKRNPQKNLRNARKAVLNQLQKDIIEQSKLEEQANQKRIRGIQNANEKIAQLVKSGNDLRKRELAKVANEDAKQESARQRQNQARLGRANRELSQLVSGGESLEKQKLLAQSQQEQQLRKSNLDLQRAITSETNRVVTQQGRLAKLIATTNTLREQGRLQLSAEEAQILNNARAIVSTDPKALARANLGLASTVPEKQISSIKDTASSLGEVNKQLRSLGANTTTMDKFGKATALAFKRYSAFLVGSFGIFRLVGFFRTATDEALKFERAVTKITQVLNTTNRSIKPLTQDIKQLAKTTGISATELAEGAFIFAQAGIKDVQALRIITEQLAKIPLSATFDDIKSTSEGLLAVFGQFRLDVSDTGRVLDLVNQFAADFATEAKDLFEIIKRGGATFSIAGGQIEEFLSFASVLRETTRESASVIGTFFKTGFAQILRPQSQAELRKLGITTSNVVEQVTALSDVLFGPQSNFTAQEQINIARNTIGDSRQVTRYVSLLRALQDPSIRGRLETTLASAAGSLDQSIANRLDDVGTSLNRIQRSFQDFIITLSENERIKNFAQDVASLAETLSGLSGVMATIIPLLAPLLVFFGRKPAANFARGFGSLFGVGAGRRGDITSVLDIPVGLSSQQTDVDRQIISDRRKQLRRRASLQRAGAGAILAGLVIPEVLDRIPEPTTDRTSFRAGKGLIGGAATGGVTGAILGGAPGAAIGAVIGGLVGTFSALNDVAKEELRLRRERLVVDKPNFQDLQSIIIDFTNERSGQLLGLLRTEEQNSQLAVRDLEQEIRNKTPIGKTISDIFEQIRSTAEVSVRNLEGDFTIGDRLSLFNREIETTLINLASEFNQLDQLPLIKSLFSLTSRSVKLEGAGLDLTQFEVPVNILKDKLIEVFTFVGESIKQSVRDADLFSIFITDLNEVLTTVLPSDNELLLNQFGFGDITRIFSEQNRFFANELREFLSTNRDIIAGFDEQASAAGEAGERNFRQTNVKGFFDAVFGELQSSDLIKRFGDIFGQLASESDLSLFELFDRLRKFDGDLNELITSLRSGSNIEESLSNAIRSRIEVLNRELQTNRALFESVNNLDAALTEFNNKIRELQDTLQDTISDQDEFISGQTNLFGRGNTLLGRSQNTQFGNTSAFIQSVLSQAQTRLSDKQRSLELRAVLQGLGGQAGTDDIFGVSRDTEQSQQDFITNQRLVNERLTDLASRISSASEASKIFREAFNKLNDDLSSAGSSLRQLTVDEIQAGITSLRKFVSVTGLTASDIGRRGGIQAATRGLNTLTDTDITSLERLLQSLGSIDLGGGLTGTSILGEMSRALAAPVVASVRSALTGETQDQALEGILSQIDEAERLQRQAFEEEVKLRQEQIALVELQKNLAELEKQFFVDQRVLLQQIADNITNNQDLVEIRRRIEAAFAGNAHRVSITDTPGKPLEVNVKQSTPDIGTNRTTRSLPSNVPLVPGPNGLPRPRDINITPTSPDPFRFDPSQVPIERLRPFDKGPFDQQSPFSDPGLRSSIGAIENVAASLSSQDSNLKNLDKLGDINSKFDTLIASSRSLESTLKELTSGITTKLEIAPMQVNVALGVPDILATVGPELEKQIIVAISNKLAETFSDDPEKSSKLRALA